MNLACCNTGYDPKSCDDVIIAYGTLGLPSNMHEDCELGLVFIVALSGPYLLGSGLASCCSGWRLV